MDLILMALALIIRVAIALAREADDTSPADRRFGEARMSMRFGGR